MFRAIAQGRAVVASAAAAAVAASASASPPAQSEALNVHAPRVGPLLNSGTVKLQAARGGGVFAPSRSSQFTLDNEWDMVDDEEDDQRPRGDRELYAQLFEKVPGQEEVEEATRELCETLRTGTILGSNGLFAPPPFAQESDISEGADGNEATPLRASLSPVLEYEITTNSAGNVELSYLGDSKKKKLEESDLDDDRMDSKSSDSMEEAEELQERPQVNVLESQRGASSTLSTRWTGGAPQWPVPQMGGARAVMQAFELFRSDPDVQETVISLARDPAVWDAFRNNHQMQELLRRRVASRITASDRPITEEREEARVPSSHSPNANPFVAALDHVKSMLSHMMGSFLDAVGSVVTRMERAIFGEGADMESAKNSILETTMRSCVVVTIVVLAVIVLRRPVTA